MGTWYSVMFLSNRYLRLLAFICVFFLLLFFSFSVHAIEDDDFWLMLEPEDNNSSLSINGGFDDENSEFYGASLDLAVADNFYFTTAGSVQESTEETSQWSWGLGNNPNHDFTWSYSNEWWGKSSVLETKNSVINFGFSDEDWTWLLGLEIGYVELYGAVFVTEIDHKSFEIGFISIHDEFDLTFLYQKHDYELDISKLNFSQFIFLAEIITRNYRVWPFVTPQSQQQATALADYESSLNLTWYKEDYSIEGRYQLVKSGVTEIIDRYVSLGVTKMLNSNVSLKVEASQLLVEDGATSVDLGMTFYW